MASYRIYLLDGAGRILRAADAQCASDEAAYEAARGFLGRNGQAEVWQGTRCLGQVTVPPPVPEPRTAGQFVIH